MNYEESQSIVRLSDSEFEFIVQFVSEHYGIDLSKKRRLIEARLASELKGLGFDSYSQYIALLKKDPNSEKVDTFINKITTNYSYFSREADHYDFLGKKIIPALIKERRHGIKVWSAGCSTGEEPYNIAMAIDSALGSQRSLWNVTISATDVSTRALNIAKEGVYPEAELKAMPEDWKKNYMVKQDDGNYRVADSIRKNVSFSRFNLMGPVLQKNHYDVIFCRNVMIYFKPATTQSIVKKFYQATAENGYLFIGHSETISRLDTEYTYISPSIYRKVTK